jgi:hypothetical protein
MPKLGQPEKHSICHKSFLSVKKLNNCLEIKNVNWGCDSFGILLAILPIVIIAIFINCKCCY